jgi:hypothetical protein
MLLLLVISLFKIKNHILTLNLAFYKGISLVYNENKSGMFFHYAANFFDTHKKYRKINSIILLFSLLNSILLVIFYNEYTIFNIVHYIFSVFLMLAFINIHKIIIYYLPLYYKLSDAELKEYNMKIKDRENLLKRELTYLEYCDLFYSLDKVKSKALKHKNKIQRAYLYFIIGFVIIFISTLMF